MADYAAFSQIRCAGSRLVSVHGELDGFHGTTAVSDQSRVVYFIAWIAAVPKPERDGVGTYDGGIDDYDRAHYYFVFLPAENIYSRDYLQWNQRIGGI